MVCCLSSALLWSLWQQGVVSHAYTHRDGFTQRFPSLHTHTDTQSSFVLTRPWTLNGAPPATVRILKIPSVIPSVIMVAPTALRQSCIIPGLIDVDQRPEDEFSICSLCVCLLNSAEHYKSSWTGSQLAKWVSNLSVSFIYSVVESIMRWWEFHADSSDLFFIHITSLKFSGFNSLLSFILIKTLMISGILHC